MKIDFACPTCDIALNESPIGLQCPHCKTEWPVVDSVPRFVDLASDYYWGEVPVQVMKKVNHHASHRGWRSALDELILEDYPEIYRYVVSTNRADFAYYFPLSTEHVVLDIGSGWGTISCLLAKKCKTVISVESVSERIEFLRIRAQQENLENIQPIQTSFLNIPLPEACLDLAVLNGVLEWIGIADLSEKPDVLQRKALRKLFNFLKPDGQIYIGIENRFGFNYFLGGKDHSDLPFTSLLPRWMANFIVQWKDQSSRRTHQASGSYRTYTYSYWGYKSLLEEVGFQDVRIFLVFPDYNVPSYIVKAKNHRAFSYLVRRMYSGSTFRRSTMRVASLIAARLHVHYVFAPSYVIFAKKN